MELGGRVLQRVVVVERGLVHRGRARRASVVWRSALRAACLLVLEQAQHFLALHVEHSVIAHRQAGAWGVSRHNRLFVVAAITI